METYTWPPSNAIVEDANTIDVVGTVAGPINTGVSVNGIPVPVVHGVFAIAGLPLVAGGNGFTATATTLLGLTSTSIQNLTAYNVQPSPISISTASTTAGFAPLTVQFNYAIGTLTNNATITSVTIDLDGDGVPEFTGTSLSGAPASFTYVAPGMYAPTLTVVDSNNKTYVADTRVFAQDLVQQRGMLCDVYGYLKDRLNQADVAGAALAYQPLVQSQYLSLFTDIGANMPSIVPMLGVIANGFVAPGYAEMTLVRDNTDQSRSGFPLRITQGSDGVWRIAEM
ncbi:MAG: hypothetical protein P4L92_16850 [Rudaea sp.]|nr:hypothetical protein [Rudaea sp.]